jgi:hypothetical protein
MQHYKMVPLYNVLGTRCTYSALNQAHPERFSPRPDHGGDTGAGREAGRRGLFDLKKSAILRRILLAVAFDRAKLVVTRQGEDISRRSNARAQERASLNRMTVRSRNKFDIRHVSS